MAFVPLHPSATGIFAVKFQRQSILNDTRSLLMTTGITSVNLAKPRNPLHQLACSASQDPGPNLPRAPLDSDLRSSCQCSALPWRRLIHYMLRENYIDRFRKYEFERGETAPPNDR